MDYDPLDAEKQSESAKASSEKIRLALRTEFEDIKWLMGSPKGRRICRRLLERAGVTRSSFNTNSMTMAFNEGVRNEGLRLLSTINQVCPDLYLLLLKEANE